MTIVGHFVRIHADPYYTTGNPVLSPADWAQFDQECAQLLNGDLGGCWAPLTQIVINGSGILLTGPLYVLDALTSLVSGAFELNQGNIPQLGPGHVGRSRVIVSPCNAGRAALPYGAVPFFYGLQSVAQEFLILSLDASGTNVTVTPVPNEIYVPLRVHNGATLGSVTVSFANTQQYTPVQTPGFRVVRVDMNGNQTVMTSAAAATANGTPYAGGYISPAVPSSASSWYNGGAAQTFTIPCDQDNVVDITQYTYWLMIRDAQGNTGYPFQLNVAPPVGAATNLHIGTVSAVALSNSGGNTVLTYATGTFHNGEVVVVSGTGTAADGSWAISGVTGTTMVLMTGAYTGGTPGGGLIVAGQVILEGATTGYIDGVSLNVTPYPVLLKDQYNKSANGIWNVQTGVWTRSVITLAVGSLVGMIVPVSHGTANTGTYWQILNSPGTALFGGGIPSWFPQEAILATQQIIPLDTNGTVIFTCTAGGTTGTTEPVWPTSAGTAATPVYVTDGTVTWQASANTAPPVLLAGGPSSGASEIFPVPGQFVAQSTLFLNAACSFSNITSVAFQ